MGSSESKNQEEKDEITFEDEDVSESDDFSILLETHLTRLISYAASSDVALQRKVAEKLANEAVNPKR